jgi:hypothetical protein
LGRSREGASETTAEIDETSWFVDGHHHHSSLTKRWDTMTDARFSLSRNSVTENPNPLADDDDFFDDNDTASQRSISLSSPPTSPKPEPETFASLPMSPTSSEAFVRAFEQDTEEGTLEPDLPSAYSPDETTSQWNQTPAQALTPAVESAFVGQSSHMYPPTPVEVRGDTESIASFATGSSTSKKAERESMILIPSDGPLVLGIALVDFNHIEGPKIEFYEGEIFEDEEIARIMPFLALPDGAHLVIIPSS